VAASACENQNVLPEVVGKADHGQRLARGHHPPIVAMGLCVRPSSSRDVPTLYVERGGGYTRSINALLHDIHVSSAQSVCVGESSGIGAFPAP
jgi:hypothetical protein